MCEWSAGRWHGADMLPRSLLMVLVVVLSGAALAQPPWPARRVQLGREPLPLAEVLAAISQQSGLRFDLTEADRTAQVPGSTTDRPIWEALDQAATATGHRLIPTQKGSVLKLLKSTASAASHDGPFRVQVRQVQSRHDFDLGRHVTEIGLNLHWEPRLPVFRITSEPSLSRCELDDGTQLSFTANRTKIPTSGSLVQPSFRLSGVPRSAKSLTLAGEYVVTAAEQMLDFSFILDKLPTRQTMAAVTVRLKRVEQLDNRVEVEVDLDYPADHPEFESFETFVNQNTATLVSRKNPSERWSSSDLEVSSAGRRVNIVYRFTRPNLSFQPTDWQLAYQTPSPLKEFPVRFRFDKIELP